MEKDYRIAELNPQFIKTSRGYLLTSQHAEVKSSVPGESSALPELLEYAEIDGVRLPSKLTAIVSLEGAPGENPGPSNSRSGISKFKRSDYVPSCQEAR
jgi:hypothetical protein